MLVEVIVCAVLEFLPDVQLIASFAKNQCLREKIIGWCPELGSLRKGALNSPVFNS
jgi:hypothetical protein